MNATLTAHHIGPAVSVQDLGRPGFRAQGLTIGGVADPIALHEGAVLLDQPVRYAALEMVGTGGTFSADRDLRIALTGAVMTATLAETPLQWNASHHIPAGAKFTIGGAREGTYGYLHIAGGIDTQPHMGSRASHMSTGIGGALCHGDRLPIGTDKGGETGLALPTDPRFAGGPIRIVASMQTDAFTPQTISRFTTTPFKRDPRANRMGVRLDHADDGFFAENQLSIVSEIIVPGDIQITGDGAPYVLMCECQTTGGYPRIGTVLPCDLPKVAQAPAGAPLSFTFLDLPQAAAAQAQHNATLRALPSRLTRLVRDPATMRDLLKYHLISGAISAKSNPFETEP